MEKGILIKNGTLITLGIHNKVLHGYALLIVDDKIKKIAPQAEFPDKYEKEIDACGMVVMPGFINAHMHFYSTLVRGLGKAHPSRDFVEVLENLWWRLDRKLELEDTYYSALIMAIQAIKNGTTTLIDHHASPGHIPCSLNEIERAVKLTGLRASLCYELSDRDGEDITKQGLSENVRFIQKCQHEPNDQFKALFGLHASFTISDETLDRAVALAKHYDTGFHVHTAEAESDQIHTMTHHGKRVVERFYDHGVLGPQTIAAHCVHVNEHEMDLLHETSTIVVHNPQSNMNNAVGIADIITLQEKGILVGLGTDAMTVNMLEEVRVAMWAQHLKHNNPTCGFMEVVNTLFTNNSLIAERYWQKPIGVLNEGALADIVCIPYCAPTPLDDSTAYGHLVFGISQSPVDTTIAGGKVLMQNRKLKINIDETEVNGRSREVAQRLWNRF